MTTVLRVRARQAGPVLPGLLRSVRWQPVALAGLLGAALLAWRHDDLSQPSAAVWLLRSLAALLAAAAAFGVDDPAAGTLAAVPTPLSWRYVARISLVVLPTAAAWTTALVWTSAHGPVPALALTLEAAAMVTGSLAASAALARWRGVLDPGVVVAPAVLGLALVAQQLPPRLDLLALPGPGWDAAHARWAVLLGCGVVLATLAVRDPASRGRTLGSWASSSP